jgi:glycine betaine/proline transport system substrate-binding protein
MKKFKTATIGALALTATAALAAGCGTQGASPSASSKHGATITIGYINWPEDVAASNLWDKILTQKGYHVKLINASVAPVFEGVGQGSINIFMDAWLPNTQATYWAKVKTKAEKINSWYTSPTQEGFVVPDYVNINSISQLKSHSSEFHGKIIGIDAGAGEMGLAKKAITQYGLPETLVTSSDSGMLAELSKAESSKSPVVVTLWSPHWAFSKWHLKYLKDPKNIFGPDDHIYTIANDKFPSQHPKVTKWLKNFKLNQSQLGQLENDINKVPANKINSAISTWVKANKSLVNSWTK